MGLLDIYNEEGLGLPRPTSKHQNVLTCLVVNLLNNGFYAALTENCIDSTDLNSQVPDLCIYRKKEDRFPFIIIEVTTKKELNKLNKKVKELLQNYPAVKEAFVYEYESKKWFSFGENINTKYSASYSTLLNIDFDDYIDFVIPKNNFVHQNTLIDIVNELRNNEFIVLPSFYIDSQDASSYLPDICIYESERQRYPRVIIEIASCEEVKRLKNKLLQILGNYHLIEEAFIYDYDNNEWFAIRKNNSKKNIKESYSFTLSFDFADCI